jgi:hypothetical protein
MADSNYMPSAITRLKKMLPTVIHFQLILSPNLKTITIWIRITNALNEAALP